MRGGGKRRFLSGLARVTHISSSVIGEAHLFFFPFHDQHFFPIDIEHENQPKRQCFIPNVMTL